VRSLHFVPAHRRDWIAKASTAGADAVVLDLEDGLPDAEYDSTITALPDLVRTAHEAFGPRVVVRVRASDASMAVSEARLCATLRDIAVMVPKVESPSQLNIFRAAGVARVLPLLESFVAFERMDAILASGPVCGIAVGFEDLLSESPYDASDVPALLQALRSRVAIAARARNVPGIDTVSLDLTGTGSLRDDCVSARAAGLTAKLTIHTVQVSLVNEVFGISPARLAWARQIVAYADARRSLGGYAIAGSLVISGPKIATARHLLALAAKQSAPTTEH
jgi:citrate lyase beta subunit